jgi:HlyD family secretion protein
MNRVLAVILVIAVLGGSWFMYTQGRREEPKRPDGIKTTTVARGSVDALIGATGSLAAERVQALTFGASGRVVQVLVKEGDIVSADQVLANLDSRDNELNLKQTQASLAVSEASLARTRRPSTPEEVRAAQAAVTSTKASLLDLRRGVTSVDIEIADLQIAQAKNTLWGQQSNRDATAGNAFSSPGSKSLAESQVLNGEIGIKIAELNRSKLDDGPKDSTIKNAEWQIAQQEASLARLVSGPTREDIAVAEAQVAQAKVGVEIAQRRLDDTKLKAPFAGQLVVWNLHVGDTLGPTFAAGTLADTSSYHIDVNVDETEISQLALGQKARITLDAFPDKQFEGKLIRINFLGSSVQGIVNYIVRVEMSPTDLPVKPLMTAAVNIVVNHKDGAMLVPSRAIKRDKQGKYVEILRNNVVNRVNITTGLVGDENTEVLSGLAEGDEVIISKPRASGASPFGGG